MEPYTRQLHLPLDRFATADAQQFSIELLQLREELYNGGRRVQVTVSFVKLRLTSDIYLNFFAVSLRQRRRRGRLC